MAKATIVLLTKNGEKYLQSVLKAIYRQRSIFTYDVLAIDSGSTDKTLTILRNFPIKLYTIPPKDFGHGKTRNLGVKFAKGSKYIIYLTQDATPANNKWLNNLILPMEKDAQVAGVYSRQIPYPDCNPLEERDITTFLNDKRKNKKIKFDENRTNRKYSNYNVDKLILFSNVSSCIRKTVLRHIPFNENILMCEDQEWCKRALEKGFVVVYQPKSKVFHSHNFSLKKLYQRNFDYGLSFRKFLSWEHSLSEIVVIALKQTLEDWRYILLVYKTDIFTKIKWIFFSPLYRFAVHIGKHRGYVYVKDLV